MHNSLAPKHRCNSFYTKFCDYIFSDSSFIRFLLVLSQNMYLFFFIVKGFARSHLHSRRATIRQERVHSCKTPYAVMTDHHSVWCMVYNLWDSLSSKLRWQLHIILHSVIKHKVEENHSASQHFLLFTKKYQNKPLTVAPPQKHSQLHCWSHLLCKSVSLTWH